MAVLRNLASFLLLLVAAAAALTGALAQWSDRAATTAAPLQEIVGPVSGDARVQAALTSTLTEIATSKIPTISAAVPGLSAHLETLIAQAVDATLADEGVDAAWLESIDSTRQGAVADIQAWAEDPASTPTLWFDLTPFIDLMAANLASLTNDNRVEVFIQEMDWRGDVRAALVRPDATQLELASQGLEISSQWRWFYGAAAVLALVGLAAGTRRGRWVCLLMVSLLSAGVAAAGSWVTQFVTLPGGSTLGSAVVVSVADGAIASLRDWLTPFVYASLGVAAFALLALIVVAVVGRRVS